MTKKITLVLLLALVSQFSFGQFSEWIASGRPGQAFSPQTAGKNVFMLQTGFTNTQRSTDIPNISVSDSWFHNTMLRYGITERFELRALGANDWGTGHGFNFNTLQLGGRYFIHEGKGAIPSIGLEGYALLPVGNESVRRDGVGANLLLLIANPINEWLTLTTNLGYSVNKGIADDKYYALFLSFVFSEKWGGYVELYDYFSDFSALEIDYDLGVNYLLSKDIQLDASFGIDSDNDINSYFFDFGVSVRLHNRETIQVTKPD